jgi:Na+/H+ antiporter NhaD/arsenite permease-like protein
MPGARAGPARLVQALERRGTPLADPWVLGPLTVLGSTTTDNMPLVVLLQVLPASGPDLLHFLAVVSMLAGNLANTITVERAKEVGVELGFLEHARCGVPITLFSLAAAAGWLLLGAS